MACWNAGGTGRGSRAQRRVAAPVRLHRAVAEPRAPVESGKTPCRQSTPMGLRMRRATRRPPRRRNYRVLQRTGQTTKAKGAVPTKVPSLVPPRWGRSTSGGSPRASAAASEKNKSRVYVFERAGALNLDADDVAYAETFERVDERHARGAYVTGGLSHAAMVKSSAAESSSQPRPGANTRGAASRAAARRVIMLVRFAPRSRRRRDDAELQR